jgi:hypothetical protein
VSAAAASGAALVPLVTEYTDAFNARDVDRLHESITDDFRFTAPHATVERGGMREFVERQMFGVGLHIRHRRCFGRGQTVVTEGRTDFVSADDGAIVGGEDSVATFSFREGRISAVTLQQDLHTALAGAGMTEGDLVG